MIMSEKRTSLFENGLIWFGAGVSIAEILTGTYLASLGMKKGLAAILLGHLIGCVLLFLAGVIGGKVRKSAMETVKISFGQKGSLFFALLNVIQLVGWTAIMIYDGALAANQAAGVGNWVWCLVIGALIVLWIVIGITNLGKLNTVAMAALFILTLILCKVIFFGDYTAETVAADGLTFGAAVELAVAMPLSWLPLISDYTREAKQPVKATAVSAIVYGVISCWMYLIGMGAAIYTGESDIAQIMVKAGLGIVGLLIIIFSTVTTTFLDAYSAGVGNWVWCLVIGALIVLWIVIGITNLGKLNTVAMAALFILTLILCKVIFFGDYTAETVAADGLTFGAAVELAVAMPLSWLPLISDYTREAKQPVKATAVSAIVYGVISCWMYLIGMGAAIYTGESDIAQIMVKAGLGIVGLLIIIFSTVTTTFLDAYSAGISSETLSHKLNGKYIAIAVTVVGALAAIVYPMDNITNFLYLIGSVFAPMIAIQIADFFLLKEDYSEKEIQISNMVLWIIGFILYRILMRIDIPVGNTLPDIAITVVLCLIWGKISKKK